MNWNDAAVVTDARRTADGYLVADARIARIGVQDYAGSEVGKPDMPVVRVYRPEAEVFHKDAMASFAFRPVTNDHPPEQVTAANWKKHAVGNMSGDVARDGDYLRIPMIVMDKAAIADWEAGKREVSCGYTCDLKWEAGVTPAGEAYDAIQTSIRGNHLAIVRAGRAGSECRIGDHARTSQGGPMATKTVMVDGFSIETTDQGAQAIEKLQKQLADSQAALNKATADHAAAIAAKDADLGKAAGELEKAKAEKLTDAALDALVTQRADVVARAAIVHKDAKTVGLSVAAIRRGAVAARLGDEKVKDKSDDYVEALFDSLSASSADGKADPLREAIRHGKPPVTVNDAHAAMINHYQDAWKAPAKGVA